MTAIACDTSKISSEELKRSLEESIKLFQTVKEVRELELGYAIYFEESQSLLNDLFKLFDLNRRCCPMLKQSLTSEIDSGTIWIELTGVQGVKEFIAQDLIEYIPKPIAIQSGLLN